MDFSRYENNVALGLTPINQAVNVDFLEDKLSSSESVEEYIRRSIKRFTKASMNSSTNSKGIDPDSIIISQRDIVFRLYSEKQLSAPGKCMKLLSKYLLEEEYFVNLKVGEKLFKTYTPSEIVDTSTGQTKVVDAASKITDAALVKSLIDYLLTPQFPYTPEKNNMRNAVEQMKALAAQSGMIKIDE